MEQYQQQYPQESNAMASLSDRLRAEGLEKGIEKGLHQGVEDTLRKLIQLKFGPVPAWADERLAAATDEQLDYWVTESALCFWKAQAGNFPVAGHRLRNTDE